MLEGAMGTIRKRQHNNKNSFHLRAPSRDHNPSVLDVFSLKPRFSHSSQGPFPVLPGMLHEVSHAHTQAGLGTNKGLFTTLFFSNENRRTLSFHTWCKFSTPRPNRHSVEKNKIINFIQTQIHIIIN